MRMSARAGLLTPAPSSGGPYTVTYFLGDTMEPLFSMTEEAGVAVTADVQADVGAGYKLDNFNTVTQTADPWPVIDYTTIDEYIVQFIMPAFDVLIWTTYDSW